MAERTLIVDTTLREGEQFAGAFFSTADKQAIALALDSFGVPFIELTSPAASTRADYDARTLVEMGLRARILAHVRCVPADVQRAIDAGVHGINLYFGLSPLLRTHSHRRGVEAIIEAATECVAMVREAGLEARFGCEDAFRTPEGDLLRVCTALDEAGVVRLSLADTVGVATPRRVDELVRLVHRNVRAAIEFHGHDDSGCAVANAHAAVEAGAALVDTTILGIGERNGITPLSALMARLYTTDTSRIVGYDLTQLRALDQLLAGIINVEVPFNAVISGRNAFMHAAGAHTAAVLRNPTTYEAIDPGAFGLTRTIHIAHHLTGRHAIAERASALGLSLDEADLASLTAAIKEAASLRPLSESELDALILTTSSGESLLAEAR